MGNIKRKVIQIADSTQLVSLPRKWALQQGLRKGDEVEVIEEGSRISISTKGEREKQEKIELDISELDKDSVIFLIRGLYVRGYNEIKLDFNKPMTKHHRLNKDIRFASIIHNETRRSTGLEIIQERPNLVILKKISESSMKEFGSILKRIFLLIIDAAKDLYLGVKEDDLELVRSLEEKHDNLTKFIFYNLRLLNTRSYTNYKDTPFLFHIISSLDFVTDTLRNVARDIVDKKIKPTKEGVLVLEQIYKSIELYYDLYYSFNFKKCEKFSHMRDKILNSIKNMKRESTKDDIFVSTTVEQCLEILRDLYSARISMEY